MPPAESTGLDRKSDKFKDIKLQMLINMLKQLQLTRLFYRTYTLTLCIMQIDMNKYCDRSALFARHLPERFYTAILPSVKCVAGLTYAASMLQLNGMRQARAEAERLAQASQRDQQSAGKELLHQRAQASQLAATFEAALASASKDHAAHIQVSFPNHVRNVLPLWRAAVLEDGRCMYFAMD